MKSEWGENALPFIDRHLGRGVSIRKRHAFFISVHPRSSADKAFL
jgi:hypothetical protein